MLDIVQQCTRKVHKELENAMKPGSLTVSDENYDEDGPYWVEDLDGALPAATADPTNELTQATIAFRAPKRLCEAIETAAKSELISTSAFVRRAVLNDLIARGAMPH
jgi:hypothetical protein